MSTKGIFLVIVLVFRESNAVFINKDKAEKSSNDTLVFAHVVS